MQKISRVLIVKISAMGDIVHTFPLVRAIKEAYPLATIDWVVSDSFVELARLSPHIDNIYAFRRRAWGRWWSFSAWSEIASFRKALQRNKYDVMIDLQGLLRSGLITFFANADKKIGFPYAREGASYFYNVKTDHHPGDMHAIDRYMSVLSEIGVENADVAYDISIPDEAEIKAAEMTPDEPFVVINPNARWSSKRWPIEKFARLITLLHERSGLRCVIIGGPEDMKRGGELASQAGSIALNLTGKGGFGFLASVIKASDGMITNDSGPMHLAAALGKKVVAVFGPTDPKKVGPYGRGHQVVSANVDCSGCYLRSCPKNFECMLNVDETMILNAWEMVKSAREPSNG